MPHDTFVFKQFTVQQARCAMKVGTDAVLLGSWISLHNPKSVLDIGTGTGVIALMLAQRNPEAKIVGVEIEESAYEQAKENFSFSKWTNRLSGVHTKFQDYASSNVEPYDLIVTNPPYFIDSSKAQGEERTNARHNDLLPFEDLVKGVVKCLKPNGRFYVILPPNEASVLRELCEKKGLHLSKLTRVKSKVGKEIDKRHLMRFEFNPTSFSESTIAIELEERHHYTDEYIQLTKDFYLNF